jgi:hypothetical protein
LEINEVLKINNIGSTKLFLKILCIAVDNKIKSI